ncbi:MAG TPA: hypothetical protein VLM37_01820 [Fibrobacteraceae bacterium]|nr:hypothetical protein [Fibrobacteraceae bacterium]
MDGISIEQFLQIRANAANRIQSTMTRSWTTSSVEETASIQPSVSSADAKSQTETLQMQAAAGMAVRTMGNLIDLRA